MINRSIIVNKCLFPGHKFEIRSTKSETNSNDQKIKICRKEAKESAYWLKLIDTQSEPELAAIRVELVQEASELTNIFGAILRKSR